MKVPIGGMILVIFLCSETVSFKPFSFVKSKKTTHVSFSYKKDKSSLVVSVQ
jgi:hypothetical protein